MTGRLAFVTVFLIAGCGLGYQLVAGSVSSYLLGDSVTQFSLTIGLFMFALGLGSLVTRFIVDSEVETFIRVELAVALIGGMSCFSIMVAYAQGIWFHPILYGNILVVGTLVGIEIPLLIRILKGELELRDLLAAVLSVDYVGALCVAFLFPLVMVPNLGLLRSSLLLGAVNGLVGLWSISLFRGRLRRTATLRASAVFVVLVLVAAVGLSDRIVRFTEQDLYVNDVIHAETTPYQRIVVTRGADDFQLFLNGALQFSSGDEYRYHEALVHPPMAAAAHAKRVLVLGGGDGLAVREILRHPEVERVILVDIDPAVVALARRFPALRALNQDALDDRRVEVIHDDAMRFLAEDSRIHDVAIVDFPDPNSFALGKLYTTTFYRSLYRRIADDGAIAIQSTNPQLSPKSFWCVVRTLESAEWFARPYRSTVPSFGEWGYVLAAKRRIDPPQRVPMGCRYLTSELLPTLFVMPADMSPRDVEINQLNTQRLVRYYESEMH